MHVHEHVDVPACVIHMYYMHVQIYMSCTCICEHTNYMYLHVLKSTHVRIYTVTSSEHVDNEKLLYVHNSWDDKQWYSFKKYTPSIYQYE